MKKEFRKDNIVEDMLEENPTILLMGSPNVGKSVFFSKLTNVHEIVLIIPERRCLLPKAIILFEIKNIF